MKKTKVKPLVKIIKEYKEGQYDVEEIAWGEPATVTHVVPDVKKTPMFFSPISKPRNWQLALGHIGDKSYTVNDLLHREEGPAKWSEKHKNGLYYLRGIDLYETYVDII